MNIQDLLYNKAKTEYNAFLSEIEQLSGKEAIDRGYEKYHKEDFLSILESCEMSNHEAKALFKLKNPLDAMYREWMKSDYSHMDLLRDTISDLANKEIRNQRNKVHER